MLQGEVGNLLGYSGATVPTHERGQGLMTLAGICARLRISRRELFRIRKADPTFPRPVDIGYARAVIFGANDVREWCKRRSS